MYLLCSFPFNFPGINHYMHNHRYKSPFVTDSMKCVTLDIARPAIDWSSSDDGRKGLSGFITLEKRSDRPRDAGPSCGWPNRRELIGKS
jgi:hypothetical protein